MARGTEMWSDMCHPHVTSVHPGAGASKGGVPKIDGPPATAWTGLLSRSGDAPHSLCLAVAQSRCRNLEAVRADPECHNRSRPGRAPHALGVRPLVTAPRTRLANSQNET